MSFPITTLPKTPNCPEGLNQVASGEMKPPSPATTQWIMEAHKAEQVGKNSQEALKTAEAPCSCTCHAKVIASATQAAPSIYETLWTEWEKNVTASGMVGC